MGYKLAERVMGSNLYRRKLSRKIMLWALANFANEEGRGFVYNEALSRYAGVGIEQVRRNKRYFEAEGMASFNHTKGKGNKTEFQLNLMAIEKAIETTPGDFETPPASGVKDFETPPASGLTPPAGGQNPTSIGGVIVGKENKVGAREGITPPDGGLNARDVSPMTTNPLQAVLVSTFGETWVNTWCEQILNGTTDKPDIILTTNAFKKSRVKSDLQTSSKCEAVRVMTIEEGQREGVNSS